MGAGAGNPRFRFIVKAKCGLRADDKSRNDGKREQDEIMVKQKWPVYGEITGPIVMIGFGSIGRGTLPLIERHFKFDKSRMTVIDPRDTDKSLLDQSGIAFVQEAVTRKNYKKLLKPLLTAGGGQGFCVNLSVDTSSLDLMRFCRELGVLYIDTVVEPWLGFYFDDKADNASRTNYALRETVREEKRANPGGQPPFRAAAPIPAWCRGSSSRRW
jgi:homospermidine synthase